MTKPLRLATTGGAIPAYIEDVFSTWLYTTNGTTINVVNGIDLAGKGGLVWAKRRDSTGNHGFTDTERGAGFFVSSNLTNAQSSGGSFTTAFNSNGFSTDASTSNFVSWTFRKQPKFFDVVTWTGDGTNNRQIPMALNSVPGCIITKCTSNAEPWVVFHRNNGTTKLVAALNSTDAGLTDSGFLLTYTSTSSFTVNAFTVSIAGSSASFNDSGRTYVAYLFAHNAGGFGLTGTDNVISCGSYVGNGDGAANPVSVNLGYEPQFVIIKNVGSGLADWVMFDSMRGLTAGTPSNDAVLYPNGSVNENGGSSWLQPSATGFSINSNSLQVCGSGQTHIYIAIRRGPMRTPTTGTSVFAPVARTGTSANTTVAGSLPGPSDLAFIKARTLTQFGFVWADRLRGSPYLQSAFPDEETTNTVAFQSNAWDVMDGVKVGNGSGSTNSQTNSSPSTYINYLLRRAPGFFDVVCYTGTGANRTVNHNLGVAPELMIVKQRSPLTQNWAVYAAPLGSALQFLRLDTDFASATGSTVWNSTVPSASVFTVGTSGLVNSSANNYVAYLFASCPGVSKVGTYTGNGTSQTIDCGFTGGARFILIKRTDSTGDWYVWDTARGIVAANDRRLSLNSTAAEALADDSIDQNSTGFIVNQVAGIPGINASGGTYIFLAIA